MEAKRYRVLIYWPDLGEERRRVYTTDVAKALRIKQREAMASIYVWAGKKYGWHLAEENFTSTN